MFKVFAGEFEGEPFLKGSPSIILLLILLLYRLVLVVELVVGAGEAAAGEESRTENQGMCLSVQGINSHIGEESVFGS